MAGIANGDSIGSRYTVIDRIGAVGLGVVYRVRDERLKREVALKTLVVEQATEQAQARLQQEAQLAASLEHPGIARVYYVGTLSDGSGYLVMELIRGPTVRQLLNEGAMDRDLALRIISSVANALSAAHSAGLIHRDVKPENIMVRQNQQVVLVDFGLARREAAVTDSSKDRTSLEQRITESGAFVGTPSYLAPEQARGRSSAKSDQFGLAVTAFELLTGQRPWEGSDIAVVLAAILLDEPAVASEVSDLPGPVDAVFARALAKDPDARFASVTEFAEAVVTVVEQGDRPASSDTSRSRGGLRVAALIAAFVCAAAGVGWLTSANAPPQLASPTSQMSLSEPESVVACPQFVAEGIEGASGWLGAAAASLTCRELVWFLGGHTQRTRGPAARLDLPRIPTDDLPPDPFEEPDAREQAVVAAQQQAAWIDGTVRVTTSGDFEVAFSLVAPGTSPRPQAHGTGPSLDSAISNAVDQLAESGTIPVRPLDPEVVEWTHFRSANEALLYQRIYIANSSGVGVIERCNELFASSINNAHKHRLREPCSIYEWRPEVVVDFDPSTPSNLALTALAHVQQGGDGHSVAAQLRAARERSDAPLGQLALARTEAMIWSELRQNDQTSPIVRSALARFPTSIRLRSLDLRSANNAAMLGNAAVCAAYWVPEHSNFWLAVPARALERRESTRRADIIGAHRPSNAISLANEHLKDGRLEAIRTLAARFATGYEHERIAARYLQALVLAEEGHLRRAYERVWEALDHVDRFGVLHDGDFRSFRLALFLASYLEYLRRRLVFHRSTLREARSLRPRRPPRAAPAPRACALPAASLSSFSAASVTRRS